MGINEKNVYIHIIETDSNNLIYKHFSRHVPVANDEMRIGGEGNEKYYNIDKVVWIYDEPDVPYERINIGVTLIT